MKKFEVGDLVKNEAYGIGIVFRNEDRDNWVVVQFTGKKKLKTTFLKHNGFYTQDSQPHSPFNIKHLSKLEKYLIGAENETV
jgi:hypothetical protein